MTTCSRPGCTRTRNKGGVCRTHYAALSKAGLVGYKPAAPVVERIKALQALGWTLARIAEAAGVGATVPQAILAKGRARVLVSTHRGIMSVPLVPCESMRGVDALPTRRRVQALMRIGWPSRVVAERVGMTSKVLLACVSDTRVSYSLAHRVADVYRELASRSGPSRHARVLATRLGYAPPAAWDYVDIDDPRARPRGVRRAA
jgi:hypothetical protein